VLTTEFIHIGDGFLNGKFCIKWQMNFVSEVSPFINLKPFFMYFHNHLRRMSINITIFF